jgi:hypothetical protein
LNRISASRLSFLNVVVLRTRPGGVENLALYLCEHNLSQPVADCLSIPLLCSPRTPCITRWGRISEQVSGLTNNRNSPDCESRDRERERERESRVRMTEILTTIDTLSYLLSWFCFQSGASCIHRSLSVRSTVEAGLTASASEAAEMARNKLGHVLVLFFCKCSVHNMRSTTPCNLLFINLIRLCGGRRRWWCC